MMGHCSIDGPATHVLCAEGLACLGSAQQDSLVQGRRSVGTSWREIYT
jgi:hypothetical protein